MRESWITIPIQKPCLSRMMRKTRNTKHPQQVPAEPEWQARPHSVDLRGIIVAEMAAQRYSATRFEKKEAGSLPRFVAFDDCLAVAISAAERRSVELISVLQKFIHKCFEHFWLAPIFGPRYVAKLVRSTAALWGDGDPTPHQAGAWLLAIFRKLTATWQTRVFQQSPRVRQFVRTHRGTETEAVEGKLPPGFGP